MIGDASLGEIVGADALASIAASDETLARRRFLLLPLLALALEQTRRQHRHRLGTIAVLGAIVLALDDEPGGQVSDSHRRIGLVDVLSPGARGAEGVDAQVRRIDRYVGDWICFGKHSHRARRSVDTALGFGGGHPLHPVTARLELELRIHILADDACDHFLVAAHVAQALRNHLDLPLVALRKARIHSKKIARKKRRFVAAGACADLEKDVALIVRVPRQQDTLQLRFELLHACDRRLGLVVGKQPCVRVGKHFLCGCEIALRALPIPIQLNDRGDLGVLAREGTKAIEVARNVLRSEKAIELFQANGELFETGGERGLHRNG